MLSKNQAKYIRSLQQKKYREMHGQYLAEGTRLVVDLLREGIRPIGLYALPGWVDEHAQDLQIEPETVTAEELARISSLSSPPPVAALFDIPSVSIDPCCAFSELVLALDDIRDPGNLGTILRIADWFGIGKVVCSPSTVDLYNPKTVQAAMGSVARVKVQYSGLSEWLGKVPADTPVYGTFLEGRNLYTSSLKPCGVIVIGNEANGIGADTGRLVTERLLIPSFSDATHAESLNAAVATAVVCAEFRRQTSPPTHHT